MPVLRKAYSQALDPLVANFITSIKEDSELVAADLAGSLAHCRMLEARALITHEQAANIAGGLKQLSELVANGSLELSAEFEDVHMNVEKQLEKLIGEDALRLHTARSRNDQVALDFRLYVTACIDTICGLIRALQNALLNKAAQYPETVMPGYTHLQRAQPVLFSHALLAFFQMLDRDFERFQHARLTTSVNPLGAGAQAGSALDIDPSLVTSWLKMASTFKNSIDAVTDRDFAADFLMAASLCSTHLSQLSETLIVWNTSEFGFIKFADSCTTSSSLMPQKKNPDPVEIVRGKAGSTTGELVNLLMTLKGLPLGYNRDLQETKPPVIRAFKSLSECLQVMAVVTEAIQVQQARMREVASDPELMATDLVEYLVVKGVPFRLAHEAIAQAVRQARESGTALSELTLAELRAHSSLFEDDVYDLFDPVRSAAAKTSPGGTANADKQVQIALESSDRL